MSHESHNHPSQIVPYEGVQQEWVEMLRCNVYGRRSNCRSDSFRFGEIDSNKTKWIHDGVVAGLQATETLWNS